jgi:hypothetical protein
MTLINLLQNKGRYSLEYGPNRIIKEPSPRWTYNPERKPSFLSTFLILVNKYMYYNLLVQDKDKVTPE